MTLGRLALDYSWDRIASDYRPDQGGLMLIGLAAMTLAPLVAAWILGRRSHHIGASLRMSP